jgi:large subunit ribosomal protein L4
LHQVITGQLATRRSGTQSTKTRSEVRGGSAKPYRQKGTGNARQGSIRAPHYAGGGVALGPKPRSYAQRTPRKMVQHALRCALSDRARSAGLRLIDAFSFDVPKTKDALLVLEALSCSGKTVVVLDAPNESVEKSFSNLAHVIVLPVSQLSAYDVLCADVVVFTDASLPGQTTVLETAPAVSKSSTKSAKASASPKAPPETSAKSSDDDEGKDEDTSHDEVHE